MRISYLFKFDPNDVFNFITIVDHDVRGAALWEILRLSRMQYELLNPTTQFMRTSLTGSYDLEVPNPDLLPEDQGNIS